MPLIVFQYHDQDEKYGQRTEVGPAEICQNLSVPIVNQSSQARLVINELNFYPQWVKLYSHILGVERNFNMLVSKYGEDVQCGSGKSHWPYRSWMEATGCCGTIRYQSEYHIQTAAPIQGYTDLRDSTDRPINGKPCNIHVHISPQTEWIVQFTWRLRGIVTSLHAAYTDALSRISWQAGACTDHQEPATCFPVEIQESWPEASPKSWSNNWVHWWPVLHVSCGSLLTQRYFGKFLLDPTSLLRAIAFVVIRY